MKFIINVYPTKCILKHLYMTIHCNKISKDVVYNTYYTIHLEILINFLINSQKLFLVQISPKKNKLFFQNELYQRENSLKK